jgi:hypothetical protein
MFRVMERICRMPNINDNNQKKRNCHDDGKRRLADDYSRLWWTMLHVGICSNVRVSECYLHPGENGTQSPSNSIKYASQILIW